MVFRYPGGKSRLVKKIGVYLKPETTFYEPFIGGGSVSIYIAKKFPEMKIIANDLDENVFSFWKLIELDNQEYLDRLFVLLKNKPTVELFRDLRSRAPTDIVEKAYYSIFFNRTTFSGIYRSGPIGGYGQNSKWTIDCRYNTDRLIDDISKLTALMKGRFEVHNLTFQNFFKIVEKTGFIYLDPPYYKEGKNLYNKFMLHHEHEELSDILKTYPAWVLSYDKCDKIKELYENWAQTVDLDTRYSVKGEKSDWKKSKEYLILPRQSGKL